MRNVRSAVPARDNQAEARVLAMACGVAAVVAWFTALVPFSPTAPTHVATLLGFVALALGVLLWALRERVGAAPIHAAVVLGWLTISASVALSTTPSGAVVTSFGLVWVAMHTAWYHSGRAAAAHLLGMFAGLGVGLWACGAPSAVQTWFFVATCVGGVAATLHRLVGRLRDVAERDALTGLYNRACFVGAAPCAMGQSTRTGRPLTMVLMDLDDFKRVNDTAGHAAGDRLLRALADAWRPVVRRSDLLARYGGDEFVMLLPDTTEEEATDLLERLRQHSPARFTAGLALWRGESLDEWLARADAQLYRGKGARVQENVT